jgi:hypothetical protein
MIDEILIARYRKELAKVLDEVFNETWHDVFRTNKDPMIHSDLRMTRVDINQAKKLVLNKMDIINKCFEAALIARALEESNKGEA